MTAPARTAAAPTPTYRRPSPPTAAGEGRSADRSGPNRRRRGGLVACVVSAAGFGVLPVLGKSAYDAGLGPLALLWGRFGLAALMFWVIVAALRPARPPGWAIAAGLGLGAFGYAVEAGLFFAALERIDASLVELLLYAYPALVTAVALARRRAGEPAPDSRLLAALALGSLGVLGVFAGSLAGGVDPAGLVLGLAAAVVYAGYVTAAGRVVTETHPVLLAALVATGATASFTVAGLVRGGLRHPQTADAWSAVALIAVVGTVIPVAALFAGIERVGAPTASIASTLEPVVTVVVAGLALGERLTLAEAAGAACVIVAVRLLATDRRGTVGAERLSRSAPSGGVERDSLGFRPSG